MAKKQYKITLDDFLSDNLGGSMMWLNEYNSSHSKYTPYNPHLLPAGTYKQIVATDADFPYITALWQSNVGANDSTVIVSMNDNNSVTTKQAKQRVKDSTYSFLYDKLGWGSIEKQIIARLIQDGSCILRFNSDDSLIVDSIFNYNVYWDSVQHTARYSYKLNGVEQTGLMNLQHGEDIYHIKLPQFANWPVPPSLIDAIYAWVVMESNGVQANSYIFSKAFVGTTLLGFTPQAYQALQAQDDPNGGKKDKEGKTLLQRALDKINDSLSGVKKAFKIGSVPGLEKVFELGKNNKDMQFLELMKMATEKKARAFGVTLTDLGTGDNSTYNNTRTFDYALYDKVGRPLQQVLDHARNTFILPHYGIRTNAKFYIKYDEPANPDKLAEKKEAREDLKADAITVNEYREMINLDPIDGGDVTYSEWVQGKQPQTGQVVDVQANNEFSFAKKIENFAKKNVVEKALESEFFVGNGKKKGLLAKFEAAIGKQLKAFTDDFAKLSDEDLKDYSVKLPKLESFYSFPAMKKDLLNFAGFALDDIKKDKRVKTKFFDGEYPQEILDYIDLFVSSVLKGDDSQDFLFPSVDAETERQLQTIIKENLAFGVLQITQRILDKIPSMSYERANIIAHTSVTECVESTRETMYKQEFPDGSKEWQTSVQDVCPICTGNESEGQIKIESNFASGHQRPSAHPRCRCVCLYFPAD